MHLHILGICGTFMGGIAALAKAAGHHVTGSDAQVYPPMSEQLAELGIELMQGYAADNLEPGPDVVVIGNALSRGNPEVEAVLDRGLPYTSGPQWLSDVLLRERWVLAVAGTHGKTSTAGMLAWVLEYAGLEPGFLIGGIPANFGVSARAGGGSFFVVEADEYDTAFFDKRSKFVHYRPRTAVLNNLEYDHADIFPDLAAIQRQFHHLVRTVPGNGLIIAQRPDEALAEVLKMGCWTPLEGFGAQGDWQARLLSADGSRFEVLLDGEHQGTVDWELIGDHNVSNALASIAAARHAGVPAHQSCAALAEFRNVKRRMELRGRVDGISVYDDFAHHPTAIRTTLAGARRRLPEARLIAVLEPRSNTMRQGIHRHSLAGALAEADMSLVLEPPGLEWDLNTALGELGEKAGVFDSTDAIISHILANATSGDQIIIMSNGGFGGIHQALLDALSDRQP